MPAYQNWTVTYDDRIATLTLNRAAHYNSITPDTLLELRQITGELAGDHDVWGVVLQGAGKHFSAGVDVSVIGQMTGQDQAAYRENLRTLQGCLDAFEELEKPTIARIRGYCLGGGLILALCCDFRVADNSAIFGLPEVKRGIAVLMGTQRITRIVGPAITREMVYLAENFDARQADAWGMLHRLVAPEALDDAVAALADKFRHLPPGAVAISKRIINRGMEMSLRESQELEIEAQFPLLAGEDFKEAVASFFEKRKPRFTGR